MKIFTIFLLAFFCATTQAREFTQTGDAMSPTIKSGEAIEVGLISAFFYEPKRWDIVLYQSPSSESKALLGRIVGMPEEEIFISEEGLQINSMLIQLPLRMQKNGIRYLPANKTRGGEKNKNRTYRTRKNEYFILGDNSFNAFDSRFIGPIHRGDILNKIDNQ
jgi:signal peptidase I